MYLPKIIIIIILVKICKKQSKNYYGKIRALDFSIVELAEYLDTHPEDKNALNLHKEYANAMHNLIMNYQNNYGPLSINCPCNKWRWIEEPWPWERSDL